MLVCVLDATKLPTHAKEAAQVGPNPGPNASTEPQPQPKSLRA